LVPAADPPLFYGFIAVAPLKLRCGLGRVATARLFHGFIAVAPLKLKPAHPFAGPVGDLFHGFIAVAPLKPGAPLRLPSSARLLFHGFIAVAPLKPVGKGDHWGLLPASSTASSPWPH